MSRYQSEVDLEYQPRSACSSFLHYTWKTITCLFSHITLVTMVVSYCALGAVTFEALEVDHEREVKKNILKIRQNVTKQFWKLIKESQVLKEDNFVSGATLFLREFEGALLSAMTKDGWDGEEDPNKVQWSSTGALFYSIVVITTIGYGHITPKTPWGKVVTIFYAILGIPLMLICLSNIGDIMATSFRILYWRVCCYVCTKKPKRNRRTRSVRSVRSEGRLSKSRNASFRRSARTSTKSADSGYGFADLTPAYYSDTELRRCPGDDVADNRRGSSLPKLRPTRHSEQTVSSSPRKIIPQANQNRHAYAARGNSLDRKSFQKEQTEIELDPMLLAATPILCNKYVVGKNVISNAVPGITTREMEKQGKSPPAERRSRSMPRTQRYLEPPSFPSPSSSDVEDADSVRSRIKRKRSPTPSYNPSPKMMTPLGYGHRSKYLDDPDSDEEFYDDNYSDPSRQRIKPVPIWLCVFLVISYIIAGMFLFNSWENWGYLDSAYFCFITLTTIGFGDLVPAKEVNRDGYYATIGIALCSLYLLFGIALLAMSFNLVQEEVISNVKSVAKSLGIIKSETDESDTEV